MLANVSLASLYSEFRTISFRRGIPTVYHFVTELAHRVTLGLLGCTVPSKEEHTRSEDHRYSVVVSQVFRTRASDEPLKRSAKLH